MSYFRIRQYSTESLTPDWYCGCSLGDGKYAICIHNNVLYLEKKSIGIKSEMFNLLTCFIIYVLTVDEEQLQFHTSLNICLRIKKVKITS